MVEKLNKYRIKERLVRGFVIASGIPAAVAAVALIGKSLGEGSAERAKLYGRVCRRIGLCIAVTLAVLYFFGGEALYRLFFVEDDIVAYGVRIVNVIIFIVLFQVLQQIEGNLIYPRVVGNSVGLPAIWVLVAVTVGGNLMGIVGMLIFIPMVSVLYTLLREWMYGRLEKKKLAKKL